MNCPRLRRVRSARRAACPALAVIDVPLAGDVFERAIRTRGNGRGLVQPLDGRASEVVPHVGQQSSVGWLFQALYRCDFGL